MSREDGVIRYMEKRYGKTFTCEGEVHGMFGSKSITVRLNCQDHPEMPENHWFPSDFHVSSR